MSRADEEMNKEGRAQGAHLKVASQNYFFLNLYVLQIMRSEGKEM